MTLGHNIPIDNNKIPPRYYPIFFWGYELIFSRSKFFLY